MNELLEAPSSDAVLRHKPNRRLTREQRTNQRCSLPLAHEVRILGIPRFNKSSVKAYKVKKLHELTHPVQPKRDHRSYTLIGIMIVLSSWSAWAMLPDLNKTVSVIFLGLVICVFTWAITGLDKIHPRLHVEWRSTEIGDFMVNMRRTVPQEALELVQELQMRLPGVRGWVEYLDTDPLLRVSYVNPNNGNMEEEYVYVWDEPQFPLS